MGCLKQTAFCYAFLIPSQIAEEGGDLESEYSDSVTSGHQLVHNLLLKQVQLELAAHNHAHLSSCL